MPQKNQENHPGNYHEYSVENPEGTIPDKYKAAIMAMYLTAEKHDPKQSFRPRLDFSQNLPRICGGNLI